MVLMQLCCHLGNEYETNVFFTSWTHVDNERKIIAVDLRETTFSALLVGSLGQSPSKCKKEVTNECEEQE